MKKTISFFVCILLLVMLTWIGLAADKEVTVMVPPWAEPSSDLLREFEDETGIQVIMNIVGWDEIRDRVSIASVANMAAADVIEVDWSWVGEFYSAEWLEPI